MSAWQEPPRPAPEPGPILIRQHMLADSQQPERIDFEQRMSYTPWASIALILVNTAIFGRLVATGALANVEAIVAAGALVRQRVLQGEAWRLFTAMFLHGSADHLVGNCVILYIVGMACEHAYGRLRTALVYLTSGLCGSLLSAALHPGPSLGASGAIFGVAGCVVVFFYRHHRAVMLRDKRIGFVLLFWAGYQIVTGFLNPWIDNFAHIGGFVGGTAAALVLWPTLVPRPERPTAFKVE
ncbi:MAG: rhomboid family intramembrane serine protease [Thermoguttaceae bacterium]|jgi:rhomboid protease GluP|nr:rhomboid family intramembrane serine protease [Thermoguttaceae bacterium]